MRYISRDPFARETLMREDVPTFNRNCDNCGSITSTNRLFHYYRERDGLQNTRSDIKGVFCSIGCMRSYHS